MKKNLIFIVVSTPTSINAFALNSEEPIGKNDSNESISMQGLPHSNAPLELTLSSNFYALMPKKLAEQAKKENEEQQKNGFVEKDSEDATQLLSYNKNTLKMMTKRKDNDMHASIKDIKLAFPYFKGISFVSKHDVIGFAPSYTYIKKGWTGVVEFFRYEPIGTCSFSISDVTLNHGSSIYNADQVSYTVNNKTTLINVEGNTKTGFSHTVTWSLPAVEYELTCAAKHFSKEDTQKAIKLAKKIDASIKIYPLVGGVATESRLS